MGCALSFFRREKEWEDFVLVLKELKDTDSFKQNLIEDTKEFLKSKGIDGTVIPPDLRNEWADYCSTKLLTRARERRDRK